METVTIHIDAVAPGVASVTAHGPAVAVRRVAMANTCQVIGQTTIERAEIAAKRAAAKLARAKYEVKRSYSGFCNAW